MNRRVVITGLGVVSSIGIGQEEFWPALVKGASGISEVTAFDTSAFSRHYGGQVKNFQPETFIDKNRLNYLGTTSQLAIAASKLCLGDANTKIDGLDKERFGVILGTTMGEPQVLEKINDSWVKDGQEAINPKLIPQYPTSVLSRNVALEFGLKGPNFIIPTACAAGNYAVGYSYDLIKIGQADCMLAGGADAFSRVAFIGFNRLLAMAPEKCQPFDKNRKGMLVGEGAGIILIESLEHALKRNAKIYAEILGYGLSCDANNMTTPDPDGVAKAIEKAIKDSNVSPDSVDYISAHGTGTPTNDKVECLALNKVFGQRTKNIAINSIKSMLGHTMGAASAIETITCCLAIKDDLVPPTINFQTPDPECDIDCIPNEARRLKVNIAINNALAFGGNNAALVLSKFKL